MKAPQRASLKSLRRYLLSAYFPTSTALTEVHKKPPTSAALSKLSFQKENPKGRNSEVKNPTKLLTMGRRSLTYSFFFFPYIPTATKTSYILLLMRGRRISLFALALHVAVSPRHCHARMTLDDVLPPPRLLRSPTRPAVPPHLELYDLYNAPRKGRATPDGSFGGDSRFSGRSAELHEGLAPFYKLRVHNTQHIFEIPGERERERDNI